MASPKIIADFKTALATKIAVGGTSVTMLSATDDDGVALPAGKYFFTIDGDNSQKEHITCTLSGTALSSIKSVSRQGIETSGVVRYHRVGSSITMTDWATYKDYIDQATLAGVVPAETGVLGGVYITSNVSGSVVPSTDDPRIPTQDENDALDGTGTPSSANKYVTEDTLTTAQALDEKVANKDTTVTLGTSDTKYPSQKAVKTYVDVYSPTVKCGVIARDINAVTGAVTTAHGLGRTPKVVRLSWTYSEGSDLFCNGQGVYDGATNSCVVSYGQRGTPGTFSHSSSTSYAVLVILTGIGDQQHAVVTVDGTNITLTWTRSTNHAGDNIQINWEVS